MQIQQFKDERTQYGLLPNRILVASLAVLFVLACMSQDATALVVKTWNGDGTPQNVNNTAPADDPGWHNTSSNRSTIYLGNQWVLTARHAGRGNVILPGGNYAEIPGTRVTLTNPSTFAGQSITSNSDLHLYRINTHPTSGLAPEDEDPLVKDITISTSTPGFNTEVLMIGAGGTRTLDANGFNGQRDFGSGSYGFDTAASPSSLKTWGTNRIASTSSVGGIVRQGLNVLVEFGNPGPNDTIGVLTRFDRGFNSSNNAINDGSLDDEAQATGGDSGGPVFLKNNNDEWVLAGLMHAVYIVGGHNSGDAYFGDLTGISDLSHYESQIQALLASNEYSVMGDVDLDGSITGSIVDGQATGDLAVLIDNWGYQQSEGDIVSWKRGDLNQDGITNLDDFSLIRDALGGSISVSQLSALVAAVAVPEPSAAMLLLLGCFTAVSKRRS